MELSYGVDDVLVESLWARIGRQANKGDIVAGLCNRPPKPSEKVDKLFF